MDRLRRVLFLAALLLFNGVVMRSLLIQDEFTPGELKAGSFDVLAGKTTLFLDDTFLNELYPLIDLYAGGELGIPPGYSAAFPLKPMLEYRVRSISQPTAPYVVLGTALPLPSSTRLDRQTGDPPRPPNASYLVDAKVLGVNTEGGLELRPWDPDLAWRVDARWLSALSSTCLAADQPLELSVRMDREKMTLRLGRCAGETTWTGTNGATPMLAVVTGPYSVIVEKTPEPWSHRSRVVHSDIATLTQVLLVIHAAVAAIAVGLVSALMVAVSLAAASLMFPFEAALIWVFMGVLSVFVVFGRLVHKLGLVWGGMLAVALLATVTLVWRGESRLPPQRLDLSRAAFDAGKGSPRCVLTGYSTVADAGLHYATPGIFGWLDTACNACAGGTTRIAWRGGAFSQIRDTICADGGPVGAGQQIVFMGGVNDDFQLPLRAESSWDRLRGYLLAGRIMFSLRELPKTIAAFDAAQTVMVSIETARRNFAGEAVMIRQAIDCAHRLGAQLWFFHDYVASDLVAGPPPGRAFLLEQRRSAVESSQGRFVSLIDATNDRAGVSWFNDIVHLSAIGHKEVGQLICNALQSGAGN
jgi:hypothetical protein